MSYSKQDKIGLPQMVFFAEWKILFSLFSYPCIAESVPFPTPLKGQQKNTICGDPILSYFEYNIHQI